MMKEKCHRSWSLQSLQSSSDYNVLLYHEQISELFWQMCGEVNRNVCMTEYIRADDPKNLLYLVSKLESKFSGLIY